MVCVANKYYYNKKFTRRLFWIHCCCIPMKCLVFSSISGHFRDIRWWNFKIFSYLRDHRIFSKRKHATTILVVHHCQSSFSGGSRRQRRGDGGSVAAVQWRRVGGGSLRRRDQFWGRGIISPFCGSRSSPSHWREKVANFPIKLLNTLSYGLVLALDGSLYCFSSKKRAYPSWKL